MIDVRTFFEGRRVVVWDIETTGIDMNLDSIIEFGAVEFVNGEITNEYSLLFNDGKSSPFLIKSIHGIKDCDRYDKPSINDSLDKLYDILSDSIMVTHNGKKFDLPFVNMYLERKGKKIEGSKLIDTIQLARKLKFKSNSLEFIANEYNIEYGGHRGLGDAKSTYSILLRLIEDLDYKTLDEIK